MSLRYASRMLLRAAQAAVRARQPAARTTVPSGTVKPGTTASAAHRPQGGQASGGAGVSAEKAIAVEKWKRRAAAQKAETVMHLVCWGHN
ncbi:hypothetical protein ACP4OV_026192 [Aristida adscensionis]